MILYYFLYFLLFIPFWIAFPTVAKGGRIRHRGRVIVISNHQSAMDIFVVGFRSLRQFHFMAKESLFKNRFLNWLIRTLGSFPVDRNATGISTMKNAMGVLNKNKLLAMFPEGSRNKENDELQRLKNGAAIFAIKCKSPIIPTYIVKRPKLFRFNRVIVGKPFELSQFYDQKPTKEILQAASDIIFYKLKELQDGVKIKDKAKQK
jgi:1-acyl-sn-glycerol-3-phosphate acyltransferase